MSKTATRYVAALWAPLAEALCNTILAHGAARAEVAGSLRRHRDWIGDIDIVLESRPDDIWSAHHIGQAIGEKYGYFATRIGAASIHCEAPEKPAVDLYLTTPETWGITLLVRSGSAAHNIRLAQRAKECLPVRKFTLAGVENSAGIVIASRSEQEIFVALGMSYVEPAAREAAELEHLVRSENP